MKKIASNELKAFLQDWLNWAEGRESRLEYEAYEGLCCASYDHGEHLRIELNILFEDDTHPFGFQEYRKRFNNDTQHKDPNRLAWVRAALNDTLDTWELME